MMKDYTRRQSAARNILADVLPLSTPYVVNIGLATVCNFRCKFCFHSDKDLPSTGFKSQIMEVEVFEKIVHQLKDFPEKIKQVCICGTGEPLINKNAAEMIKTLYEADVCENIKLVTNASMLTRDVIDKLVISGLSEMIVSLEGLSSEKYLEVTGCNIDFDDFVDNIRYFYTNRGNCRLSIKAIDVLLENDGANDFKHLFQDISDTSYIDSLAPIFDNISYNGYDTEFNHSLFGDNLTEANVCPFTFYSIFINSGGECIPCVVDYNESIVFGSINDMSLLEIWNGRALNKFRLAQLKENRHAFKVCKDCTYISFFSRPEDLIDGVKDDLIPVYKKYI